MLQLDNRFNTSLRQMKNILLLFNLLVCFLTFTASGCKGQPQNQIRGQVALHTDWKPIIYLIKPRHFQEIASDYLGEVIDSAAISSEGTFAFKYKLTLEDAVLLELVVQRTNNRFNNHLINTFPSEANYMPFLFTNSGEIKIQADIAAFQKTLSFQHPSKENQTLLSLRDSRLLAFEKYISALPGVEEDSFLIEKEKIVLQYANALMSFADTTTCMEAAMVAIRWISPSSDFERMPEFIFGQCQKWTGLFPEHIFTKQLCDLAGKNKLPIMTGDGMPDFLLPLVTGDTVKLSALYGERLTLLDIWASWCAPCRKENKEELVPLWNRYHDKGFQIISYSIDANEGPWKNAILKDGSTWTHASHLTGDSTPFMEALKISTIPANYLLDSTGTILAKNLHGHELKIFTENYLH